MVKAKDLLFHLCEVYTYRFFSGKSVSALEDSYAELQSTFSRKTAEYNEAVGASVGAPEKYEFAEGVESNSFVEQWGQDNKINNDVDKRIRIKILTIK